MTAEPADFSSAAAARLSTAITAYGDALAVTSRQCAGGNEIVQDGNVRDALKLVAPANESKLVDYVKRFTFLLMGVAITLGLNLFTSPNQPNKGQVGTFVLFAAASAMLFTIGLVADVPWIRRKILRQ